MRKVIALAATIVATMALGITVYADADVPGEISKDNMKIVWSDEFEGTELNSNNWEPQIGNGTKYGVWEWGNQEKQNYQAENISVSDGTLKIKAQYEKTTYSGTTYYWTSGRLWSSGKVNVGLGYVEARIKIPSSQGIWPAFWMLGTNGKTWPSCGEIDIMEAFNTKTYLQSTIHYNNWSGSDVYVYTQKTLSDKTQWHTYGCYRDGNICAFYIDGKLLSVYQTWSTSKNQTLRVTGFENTFSTSDLTTGDYAGQRSVLNDDYYLLLNVACGGNLAGGNPPTSADWSATMEVDYVRYYQNKTAEEIAADKKAAEEASKKAKEAAAKEAAAKAKPAQVKITSVKNVKKRKISLKFKKVTGAKGYYVRYCDNSKFYGYIQKSTKKANVVLKNLSKKQRYWIKIRAYKVYNKKKIYGSWSKVKNIKVNK